MDQQLAQGDMRAELAVLRQHGERAGMVVGRQRAATEDVHLAVVRLDEPPHDAEGGGLAGAVGADEAADHALRYGEIEPARATVRP